MEKASQAEQETKRKNGNQGEFFLSLDFLVTFLAMKKVTEKALPFAKGKEAPSLEKLLSTTWKGIVHHKSLIIRKACT